MGDHNKGIKHNTPETGNFEQSPISEIMGGILMSEFHAKGLAHATANFEPFYLISLEITSATSLKHALDEFFTSQEIDDYTDEATKEKIKATHKIKITKFPRILVFHFKRFVYSQTKQTVHKIPHHIAYDAEFVLDEDYLSKKLKIQNKGAVLRYQLFAVIVHNGKFVQRGHYTCYTRDCNGKWEYYDDKTHQTVNEKQAIGAQAYVLFYERKAGK